MSYYGEHEILVSHGSRVVSKYKFVLSWVTAEIAVFPSARSGAEGVSRGAAGADHATLRYNP